MREWAVPFLPDHPLYCTLHTITLYCTSGVLATLHQTTTTNSGHACACASGVLSPRRNMLIPFPLVEAAGTPDTTNRKVSLSPSRRDTCTPSLHHQPLLSSPSFPSLSLFPSPSTTTTALSKDAAKQTRGGNPYENEKAINVARKNYPLHRNSKSQKLNEKHT